MSNSAETKRYVLDTNTLIGFSLWLPIELNKQFWSKLEEALQNNTWVLLDVIVNEIRFENDGLKKWCDNQRKKGLQKNINDAHRERAVEINNQYKMINETTGKSTGDTYLIAYAEENKLTILSRESHRIKGDDLYKIPDVCELIKVNVTNRPKEFLIAIGYKN